MYYKHTSVNSKLTFNVCSWARGSHLHWGWVSHVFSLGFILELVFLPQQFYLWGMGQSLSLSQKSIDLFLILFYSILSPRPVVSSSKYHLPLSLSNFPSWFHLDLYCPLLVIFYQGSLVLVLKVQRVSVLDLVVQDNAHFLGTLSQPWFLQVLKSIAYFTGLVWGFKRLWIFLNMNFLLCFLTD